MYTGITITGRRIQLESLGAKHNRLIVAGTKSMTESLSTAQKLIKALVKSTDDPIDWATLSISEETDILYLLRLFSLRNVMIFGMTCPNGSCRHQDDYQTDIRLFKRNLIHCGNKECPCWDKAIYDYDPKKLLTDDVRNIADFTKIPFDHLTKTPPKMEITLEECGKTAKFFLPRASSKARIGMYAETDDIDIINKSLSTMISDFDGKVGEDNIKDELDKLSSYDVFKLRDAIQDQDGGIEHDVDVACKKCKRITTFTVSMASSFFLPKYRRSTPLSDSDSDL